MPDYIAHLPGNSSLNTDDFRRALGCSPKTFEKWLSAGVLPAADWGTARIAPGLAPRTAEGRKKWKGYSRQWCVSTVRKWFKEHTGAEDS
jgi:hypothetical protein